jgi:TolA-binding protein
MVHLRQAVPGAPRAHYTLGVELLKDGRYDEGIAELQTFVREQPNLRWVIAAHGFIGQAYAQQEKWVKAEAAFREVLKLSPDNPAALTYLGYVLESQRSAP